MRTNEKRRLRNRAAKSALKSSLKRVDALIETKDPEAIQAGGLKTLSAIGKAKAKKIIPRNKARRLQSRTQRKVNKTLAAREAAPAESTPVGEAPAESTPAGQAPAEPTE